MSEDLLFSIDGYVSTILLNRPQKLSAVTPEMAKAINAATGRCNTSDDVSCVVVGGAGDKAFCAGSDIRELDDCGLELPQSAGRHSQPAKALDCGRQRLCARGRTRDLAKPRHANRLRERAIRRARDQARPDRRWWDDGLRPAYYRRVRRRFNDSDR
jgi:enoyl-CoA hydratase/carnithine racemase